MKAIIIFLESSTGNFVIFHQYITSGAENFPQQRFSGPSAEDWSCHSMSRPQQFQAQTGGGGREQRTSCLHPARWRTAISGKVLSTLATFT